MLLLLSAAGRRSTLLSCSTLRQLGTLLGHEGSSAGSSSRTTGGEHHRSSSTSSSSSPLLPSRRALFTSPGPGSNSPARDPPTEEAESHSSVPEGATLAEEGERAAAASNSSSSLAPPKRNKKSPLPPSLPPSFDPLRTADALWPQSNAQRRVGQRVHRALQAILSQPRSATLPEGVAQRLLGSDCGLALAGARASPDGKSVFVLYDCSSGAEENARNALKVAAGPLRAAVSRVAGFKKVPRLVFVRDGEGGGGGGGGGGKRENGSGSLSSSSPGGRRKERPGGTVGEIEAEMARLGLIGAVGGEGGGKGEEGEEETEEEEEEEDEGASRGSRL